MPVNANGEEVDEIEWECPDCGSEEFEVSEDQHSDYLGFTCRACGYMQM